MREHGAVYTTIDREAGTVMRHTQQRRIGELQHAQDLAARSRRRAATVAAMRRIAANCR